MRGEHRPCSEALLGVWEHSFHQMLTDTLFPAFPHGLPSAHVEMPQPYRFTARPHQLEDKPRGCDAGFYRSFLDHELQPQATCGLSPNPALSTCDHMTSGQNDGLCGWGSSSGPRQPQEDPVMQEVSILS